MTTKKVSWNEIQSVAEGYVFNVLVSQPELAWARKTWSVLSRRGFTSFTTPEEHVRVLLRFIALGSLYDEFASIVLEEGTRGLEELWAEELGLTIDRDSDGSGILRQDTFKRMLNEERQIVTKSLYEEHRTDSGVFIHFWRSLGTKESDWEIVNDNLSTGKRRGFEWVSNGLTS